MAKKRMAVTINAPPKVVFDLLTDDRVRTREEPAATHWRPVDEGPLRVGFTMENTRIHDGHTCRSRLRITKLEPNALLEETVESHCAVAGRASSGVHRFELKPKGLDTIVTSEFVGRLEPIKRIIYFFAPSIWDAGLPRVLGYLKFEAERRFREQQPEWRPDPPEGPA